MKQDKIIELYRGELWECQLLESMLKSESIDCFLRNEVGVGYSPIIISAQLIQVMIKESDKEAGINIVDKFKQNYLK